MDKDRECFIHEAKVKRYLLKEGTKHFAEFSNVGYTFSDGERLTADIADNFSYSKAVEKKTVDGSERFVVYMELGVTKTRRFRTVWQKDTPDGIPRFLTAYRKD